MKAYKIIAITFSLLLALTVPAEDIDHIHKDFYREFVRLRNFGEEEDFYAHTAKYKKFLWSNQMYEAYFKIKTNEGFYFASHQHPLRAMRTATELEEEIMAYGDTTLLYLPSGLKGDIYKQTHNIPKADSTYIVALKQVGKRDHKFTMVVHMNLAEVNLTTNPEKSLEWANLALHEADSLNNYEHRSMALGTKCYIFFMLAERDSFMQTKERFYKLKEEFDALDEQTKATGRQHFSSYYDKVMAIAQTAFDGKFKEAVDMADIAQLNVDRQMVIFRIYAMEGEAVKEKAHKRLEWGFAAMTALYIFVYIMGRRRLMRKIRRRKEELKVAMEKAEVANKMKAAFIRSMSHEIRTPLNVINGFSQILCSNEFNLSEEEKKDMKKRIMANSESITLIINELLELSAGESVTLDESNLTDTCPNELGRKAIAKAGKQNDKGLSLVFKSDLADSFVFKNNEDTISRVLEKILDNAVKFTSKGSVTLEVSRKDDSVLFSISDTGVGIPEDKQNEIFDNFVKLDDYKEGVGLGLPICRRLAHSLGGDIVLDRKYKNGSRFILQLPIL